MLELYSPSHNGRENKALEDELSLQNGHFPASLIPSKSSSVNMHSRKVICELI